MTRGRGGGQEPDPLAGHVRERPEGLGRGRELLPDAAGAGEALGGGGLDGGQLTQTGPGDTLGLLNGAAAPGQGLLVLVTGLQEGLGLDDVVGQEPGGGVTDLDLDAPGAPGDGGLSGQGAELATQLLGEVSDAGEVGGHGLQLAKGAFLALAVLEDAGGLLDEAAAVLRRGAQDRVELPLPDDDVHLAPEARVAEELLDVEEAARAAVDAVLRPAAAEQGARDGDLGVVDRQGAVGVVDGQGDLGTPEGRAGAGAGEDDVGHGATAQVLGALLPHDPGQGVDDIGLAGPVGSDHGGDAWLQAEGGRRREGLESLDRQRLEVHGRHPNSANGSHGDSNDKET